MKKGILSFPPAYFAMVMATGIISLAAHAQHLAWVADGLFYLNLGLYPLFLLLLLTRVLRRFEEVKTELTSHEKGATYLALVAATCLLGNQLVLLRGQQALGLALWGFAGVCWVLLLYAFVLGVTLRRQKPPLETGLGGNWLLLVVSTQSLAVLGAGLVPQLPGPAGVGELLVLGLFLLGSLFYVVLSTLLFYRLTFVRVEEEEIGAAYWICVGGSAITVLAGTALLPTLAAGSALAGVAGFVKGWTVLFWVASTWWIPIVAILRAWHHTQARPAFSYQPAYWSMVFPLGMYAASTGRLAQVLALPALQPLSTAFLYMALLAWVLTLLGMLYHLLAPAAKTPTPA
jgi:tellurite resistance protein TehA-like permease